MQNNLLHLYIVQSENVLEIHLGSIICKKFGSKKDQVLNQS